MICFPYYWKEELDRVADRLDRRQSQRRWSQRSEGSLERDVFLGLFAVRKLIHSRKVPGYIGTGGVDLTQYPARNDVSLRESSDHFAQRFDMRHGSKVAVSVYDLTNMFIHSNYFARSPRAGRDMGVLFTSDRRRRENLFEIKLTALAAIFRKAGRGTVTQQLDDLLAKG